MKQNGAAFRQSRECKDRSCTAHKHWHSTVTNEGKRIGLGGFNTREEAVASYLGALRAMGLEDRKTDPVLEKYREKMARPSNGSPFSKERLKKALSKKGHYESKKDEYADKIIDYPDSPTGKAYIGINKTPLIPLKGGYGFEGVLVQDDSRKFIQCASCGKWLQKLSKAHLKSCCDMNAREYKIRYGLYQQTGLMSDELAIEQGKRLIESTAGRNFLRKAKSDTKRPDARGRKLHGNRLSEFQNQKATCPEQIKARLAEFIHSHKYLPSQYNRGAGIMQLLISRHGGVARGLAAYGLPFRPSGSNSRFIFPDGNTRAFDLTNLLERDKFYQSILKVCPLLSEYPAA